MRNTPDANGAPLSACYRESSRNGTTYDETVVVQVLAYNAGQWEPVEHIVNMNFAFRLISAGETDVWDCDDTDNTTIGWIAGVYDFFPFTSYYGENGIYYLANGIVQPWDVGGFSWQEYTGVLYGPYGASIDVGTVSFVSPDMNGDGVVNLGDAGEFNAVMGSAYHVSADFNYDGVINLSDTGILSAAMGHGCLK